MLRPVHPKLIKICIRSDEKDSSKILLLNLLSPLPKTHPNSKVQEKEPTILALGALEIALLPFCNLLGIVQRSCLSLYLYVSLYV